MILNLILVKKLQKKSKSYCASVSQNFQSVWMEFGMLLRFVHLTSLILTSCCLISVEGREPYLGDFSLFVFQLFLILRPNVGMGLDLYKLISFKLAGMIDSTEMCSLRPVCMTFI